MFTLFTVIISIRLYCIFLLSQGEDGLTGIQGPPGLMGLEVKPSHNVCYMALCVCVCASDAMIRSRLTGWVAALLLLFRGFLERSDLQGLQAPQGLL